MSNNQFFILYGIKENDIYYISNTNPVIWTSEIEQSKLYFSELSAKISILRDYDNYRIISNYIDNKKLDEFYVARIENYQEKERTRLL